MPQSRQLDLQHTLALNSRLPNADLVQGITPETGEDKDLRDPMSQPVLGTLLAGLKSSKAD